MTAEDPRLISIREAVARGLITAREADNGRRDADPYDDPFYRKDELRSLPGARDLRGTNLGVHALDVMQAAEIDAELRSARQAHDDERFAALLDFLGETR